MPFSATRSPFFLAPASQAAASKLGEFPDGLPPSMAEKGESTLAASISALLNTQVTARRLTALPRYEILLSPQNSDLKLIPLAYNHLLTLILPRIASESAPRLYLAIGRNVDS